MAEITINLLHDLKAKHLEAKPKPPFVFGLRTGYVRAWIFVVFKVWLIVALVNGVTTFDRMEKDIVLLDSYINNDFSHPEIFFDDIPQILVKPKHNKSIKVSVSPEVPRVAGDMTPIPNQSFTPRGPSVH